MSSASPSTTRRMIIERTLETIIMEIGTNSFDYTALEKRLRDILQMTRSMEVRDLEANTLRVMGYLEAVSLRFEEALATLNAARTIAERACSPLDQTRVDTTIGVTYHFMGDFANAVNAYERALSHIALDDLPPGGLGIVLSILVNSGMALHSLNRIEEAETKLVGALSVFEQNVPQAGRKRENYDVTSDAIHVANAHSVLSGIYLARAEYDKAWSRAVLCYEMYANLQAPARVFAGLTVLLTTALVHPNPPRAAEALWQEMEALTTALTRDNSSLKVCANQYLQQAQEWRDLFPNAPWLPEWGRRMGERALALYTQLGLADGAQEAQRLLDDLSAATATSPQTPTPAEARGE